MAFYKEKGWWKSKTVWTGIISVVTGVAALFGIVLPADMILGAIMTVVGLLTVGFRTTADSKIVTSESTTVG